MNKAEYARMDAEEASGWWFVGKRLFVEALLRKFVPPGSELPLLDVGCGTGATLFSLESLAASPLKAAENRGSCGLFGVDPAPEALQFARRQSRAQSVCGSAHRLPFAAESFGTVLLLDVLEHLKEDRTGLKEVHRVLQPGGAVVVTVPAFPALWSSHDVALHHFRRYRRRTLQDLLTREGFQIHYLGYGFAATFPVVAISRLLRRILPFFPACADVGTAPAWINQLLIAWMQVESRLAIRSPLPFGTSLLAVARRSEQGGS